MTQVRYMFVREEINVTGCSSGVAACFAAAGCASPGKGPHFAARPAAQLAGGEFWSLSRGEAEQLVASGEPLPKGLQEVVDRHERGQGLHTALRQGQEEEALALLEFDPKLAWHKDPGSGGYPIHVAAWQGQVDVVRALSTQPGVVEQRDGRRDTPLAVARALGHAAVEEVLLAAGANPHLASFASGPPAEPEGSEGGGANERSYTASSGPPGLVRQGGFRGGRSSGRGRSRKPAGHEQPGGSQCPW